MRVLIVSPNKNVKKIVRDFIELAFLNWKQNRDPKNYRDVASRELARSIKISQFEDCICAIDWLDKNQNSPKKYPSLILYHHLDGGMPIAKLGNNNSYPLSVGDREQTEIEQTSHRFYSTANVQVFSVESQLPWLCLQFVERLLFSRLISVKSIEEGKRLKISKQDIHCLQTVGVELGAKIIKCAPLDGGLSGAAVYKANFLDEQNVVLGQGVVKIQRVTSLENRFYNSGNIDSFNAEREHKAYERFVKYRLPIGSFADELKFDSTFVPGNLVTLYRFAQHYSRFDIDWLFGVNRGSSEIVRMISSIERSTSTWLQNPESCDMKLGFYRQEYWMNRRDDKRAFDRLKKVHFGSIEQDILNVTVIPQHGDLHALNIMVHDESGQGLLIDFGRLRYCGRATDPLTLELSIIFHPTLSRDLLKRTKWPYKKNLENWMDLDRFIDGAPPAVATWVKSCRSWTERVEPDRKRLLADLYCYLVWQASKGKKIYARSLRRVRTILPSVIKEFQSLKS